MPTLSRPGLAVLISFGLAFDFGLAGQEQACSSRGRDEALGCEPDQVGQVSEDNGETVGLMQLKKRTANLNVALNMLNDTILEQLLKKKPDLGGFSDSQVTDLAKCVFITCLNFLDPDRETACTACVQKFINTVESTAVGVNGVAVGYAKDMLGLLLRSYSESWCGGDVATCSVKENFPGPNVTSIMGWDNVAEMLAQNPAKEWSGEWWRGNELGYIINNPFFWSSSGVDPISIVLGALPSQHIVARPIMETLFNLGPKSSGMAKQVRDIVTSMTSDFLATRAKKGLRVPDDVKALVHQILNRVAFNRDVSFEYAQEFIALQTEVVALGTVSQILPAVLYKFLKPIRAKVAAYVEEYAALLKARFGDYLLYQDCSPSKSCVYQAASMVWDAFYSAGGLSVPSTISTGIGLLFSKDSSNPFPSGKFSRDQALSFYWENIRYFPPVVGFPHWETRPVCAGGTAESTAALNGANGSTKACPTGENDAYTGYPAVNQYQGGVRVVPNLALAQRDPKKWGPDADKFVIRPVQEYQKKSLGFAEAAVNDSVAKGAMNRACPGKALALMIGATFFELFNKDDWAAPYETIEFKNGPVFVSGFTLSSKQMVKDCEEICPDCGGISSCYEKAKCEASKAHCSVCKSCKDDPPAWWDLVRQAACLTC